MSLSVKYRLKKFTGCVIFDVLCFSASYPARITFAITDKDINTGMLEKIKTNPEKKHSSDNDVRPIRKERNR